MFPARCWQLRCGPSSGPLSFVPAAGPCPQSRTPCRVPPRAGLAALEGISFLSYDVALPSHPRPSGLSVFPRSCSRQHSQCPNVPDPQEKSYTHQQSPPPQPPATGSLLSVSAGPRVLGISATRGFYVTDCVQALFTRLRVSLLLSF